MLKQFVLATLLTCGAAAAYAQPQQQQQQATTPPPKATAPATTATPAHGPAVADARKLIGRNIKNAQDETIGEIKSIYLSADGKVDSVIASVGGFLGIGDREVRIAWSDLKISDNGGKVMVNMTKDQLKGKPAYKYANESWRGQVFNDTGPYHDTRADNRPANDRMAATGPTTGTTSTGDFNAQGEMSGEALIGATVRNQANESVGKVEDVYVDNAGAIKTVVVSVGGFLGVGTKDVAVKWSDLKFTRDGRSLAIMTNWTKDSLKAMPDYKYERRRPAAPARSGG